MCSWNFPVCNGMLYINTSFTPPSKLSSYHDCCLALADTPSCYPTFSTLLRNHSTRQVSPAAPLARRRLPVNPRPPHVEGALLCAPSQSGPSGMSPPPSTPVSN